MSAELGLQDRIHFLGEVSSDELPAYLHACDIFVFPSITPNEAFGLVQVEAMACGKPVICCNLRSGVPFVNRHEETGLVVEPCNVDALSRAITALAENPALRVRYGEAGRLRAEREFSEPVMLDRYWALFQELTLGHAKR
jgi:rhamnosyl/mannosyltransferase